MHSSNLRILLAVGLLGLVPSGSVMAATEPSLAILGRTHQVAAGLAGVEKVQVLVGIATRYADCGFLERARAIFAQALDVAQELDEDCERRDALSYIALGQARGNLPHAAVETLGHLSSTPEYPSVLLLLLEYWTGVGDIAHAMRLSTLLPLDAREEECQAWNMIVAALAAKGRTKAAERALGNLSADVKTANALVAQAGAGMPLTPSEQIAVSCAAQRALGILWLVEAYANRGDFPRALALARANRFGEFRDASLRRVAVSLAERGQTETAREIAASIDSPASRDAVFAAIAVRFGKGSDGPNAERALSQIEDPISKALAQMDVGIEMLEVGNHEQGERKFRDAFAAVEVPLQAREGRERRFGAGLLQTRGVEAATEWAQLATPSAGAYILASVAVEQAKQGDIDGAALNLRLGAKRAAEISFAPARATCLTHLTVAALQVGEASWAEQQVHNIVFLLKDPGGGTDVILLRELATAMCNAGARELASEAFSHAVDAALKYPEAAYRGELLREIAKDQVLCGQLQNAQQWIDELGTGSEMSQALLGLIDGLMHGAAHGTGSCPAWYPQATCAATRCRLSRRKLAARRRLWRFSSRRERLSPREIRE